MRCSYVLRIPKFSTLGIHSILLSIVLDNTRIFVVYAIVALCCRPFTRLDRGLGPDC